jgi:hypothetical protein
MSIRIRCPNSQQEYTVNDLNAGKRAECKVCGQQMRVPAAGRAEPESIPVSVPIPTPRNEPTAERFRDHEPEPERESRHEPEPEYDSDPGPLPPARVAAAKRFGRGSPLPCRSLGMAHGLSHRDNLRVVPDALGDGRHRAVMGLDDEASQRRNSRGIGIGNGGRYACRRVRGRAVCREDPRGLRPFRDDCSPLVRESTRCHAANAMT